MNDWLTHTQPHWRIGSIYKLNANLEEAYVFSNYVKWSKDGSLIFGKIPINILFVNFGFWSWANKFGVYERKTNELYIARQFVGCTKVWEKYYNKKIYNFLEGLFNWWWKPFLDYDNACIYWLKGICSRRVGGWILLEYALITDEGYITEFGFFLQ